jgi:hypothetical protein
MTPAEEHEFTASTDAPKFEEQALGSDFGLTDPLTVLLLDRYDFMRTPRKVG